MYFATTILTTSFCYWKSIVYFDIFLKKLEFDLTKVLIVCGFFLGFLKRLTFIYHMNRLFRNFLKNIPVGILYIYKFKRFFLRGRVIHEYIGLQNSVYSGLTLYIFIDYLKYIVGRKLVKYAHFFIGLFEISENFQFYWYDVIGRVKDMSIGFLKKENFFYKVSYSKVNYFIFLPVSIIKYILIFLSIFNFVFVNNYLIDRFYKTFSFFVQML